ncbi:MAG: mechanosensitive ion channel family protein [Kiritimatiellae bacterium]|nr:mechanosensitive ion channel family protein [Kiritimatiellia bacterium]MDD5519398.1 mechanosensitive ion channel family protein [Kiritimatiellia bacterium]
MKESGQFFNIWLSGISQEIWLIVIWILGGILAAKITRLVWTRVLIPMAKLTNTKLNVMVLEKTQHAIQLVALSLFLDFGMRVGAQSVPTFSGHSAWTLCLGGVFVVLILSITLVLYEATTALTEWYGEKIAGKTEVTVDDQFLALFQKTARVIFFFIAATIILEHFGVKITGLLATAGVASLAIAFAAQETLSNMISGFVLMIDRPFKVGDRIELSSGKAGDILEVGLRSTRIMSLDNTVITIPNAEIAKSQIVNLNLPNPNFKVRATLGISYDADVRKAKDIIREVLLSNQDVFKTPPPEIYFMEFGESALDIYYECWISNHRDQRKVRDSLNLAIKDRFDKAGIEIPFPQREIRIKKDV